MAEAVSKLTITAYKNISCSGESAKKAAPNTLVLQVNPQELTYNYIIDYTEGGSGGAEKDSFSGSSDSATGGSYKPLSFNGYAPPNLKISTIVDATGVLPMPTEAEVEIVKGGKPTVELYIKRMKEVMYDWINDEHGPPFLTLNWGSVLPSSSSNKDKPHGVYKCQLKQMDVKYTLFSKEGMPVRAEIELEFIGIQSVEDAAEGYSPDLTHLVDIKYGDNLPKLCKEIYGSPEFYMQIARINNLPSIYALEPGMKLRFPPLDKASR